VLEASNGGRTVGLNSNRGGGFTRDPPSKGDAIELTEKAELRGISWNGLSHNCISALQMSATNKGCNRPRGDSIRGAWSTTAIIRVNGSGEGKVHTGLSPEGYRSIADVGQVVVRLVVDRPGGSGVPNRGRSAGTKPCGGQGIGLVEQGTGQESLCIISSVAKQTGQNGLMAVSMADARARVWIMPVNT
jgi:hypothetical protein